MATMLASRPIFAIFGLSIVAAAQAQAPQTFAFQGLYAGNNGAFTFIDGNSGPNDSSNPFIASKSFTGLDRSGATQTMTVSGSAYSSAGYGGVHVFGEGTVTNSYYNSSNPAYYDGTLDESGSPDLIAVHGNAGWSDILTYTGVLGPGYRVNYYFRLEGSVNGDIEAGLNFSTSAGGSFPYNPRTSQANVLWITPFYDMSWGVPTEIDIDFFAGLTTYASNYADGSTISGYADYSNTLTLAGIGVVDANGNPVTGWSVSSASGTSYPVGAVPEPASFAAVGLGIAMVLRRRRA